MDNFDTKLETITGVGKTLVAVIFSEIGGDNAIRNVELGIKFVASSFIIPHS